MRMERDSFALNTGLAGFSLAIYRLGIWHLGLSASRHAEEF
jgi:hypothetical protein